MQYGFDDRGRLQKVGDGGSATKYISSTSYQPSQQIASIALANGLTENYGYSTDRLQLTSQNVKQGTNTLMTLGYNYVAPKSRSGGVGTGNANTGQLMDISSSQINAQQRNESYNYDQVARLTQASGFYAQRNYTYDRWGNRTGVSGGSSQTVTLQQPGGGVTNNRIANVNSGPSYTYDAGGGVTYDAGHSYGYDAESRMVTVDSGATTTNFYDAANRRVKKVAGGYTTYYVWEGSNVIAEYGNAPVGSGGTRFYHPDRLSNRMTTDGSGVVKGTMDNLPFGEDAGVVGESEKHRFTTYERDIETGSDYAMNRQHHYVTGRFMRPDPVAGYVIDPQSMNRYAYALNDPVNLVDPLGLFLPGPGRENGSNNTFDPNQCYTLIVDGIEVGSIGNCGGGGGGGPVGGGGTGRRVAPQQSKQHRCSDIANLADAKTGTGLLSRLIFAEATGSYSFGGSSQDYISERYAIAATIYNRVAFLSQPGSTLGVGMRGSGVSDVIGSRGASAQQFAGFTYNDNTGQVNIKGGIQGKINRAQNSPIGSNECNDLLAAIFTANQFQAGRGLDPFGTGMSFGFRTTDTGSPGSAFPLLGTFPGSGNTFYGPPRR